MMDELTITNDPEEIKEKQEAKECIYTMQEVKEKLQKAVTDFEKRSEVLNFYDFLKAIKNIAESL